MRRTLSSSLRLLRQCLLLGFLLTPVMAVGQGPDFEETLRLAEEGMSEALNDLVRIYVDGEVAPEYYEETARLFRLAATL